MGLTTLEHEVSAHMREMADDGLARQEKPGVVIPLLVALAEPPRGRRSAETSDPVVDDLLDRALVVYPASYLVAELAGLIRKRAGAGSARAGRANRAEVEAHLREADGK